MTEDIYKNLHPKTGYLTEEIADIAGISVIKTKEQLYKDFLRGKVERLTVMGYEFWSKKE